MDIAEKIWRSMLGFVASGYRPDKILDHNNDENGLRQLNIGGSSASGYQ
jgi:hypothetical protein